VSPNQALHPTHTPYGVRAAERRRLDFPMPWTVAIAFSGYAALLLWQCLRAFELGKPGILAVPYLMLKLSVMAAALAYWDPGMCFLTKKLPSYFLSVATIVAVQEAWMNIRLALVDPQVRHKLDNTVVALTMASTVVFPAVMLVLAARVILFQQCAQI